MMERRTFLKTIVFAGFSLLVNRDNIFAMRENNKETSQKWSGWRRGQFQVHFIYTGVSESLFIIFPDSTSLLLDCGDTNGGGIGNSVPKLPNTDRRSGEWVARYIQRVNPKGNDVDYMVLSHYHSDHGGCKKYNAGLFEDGDFKFALSGFSQAAQYLKFHKAIDRCWPDYNDPIPLEDNSADNVAHMKVFYNYMHEKKGLEIQKFELGAVNQITMLKDPNSFPNFYVRNICGNGRVATLDGKVVNLYEEYIREKRPKCLNENGMSLGMVFNYGLFRFFTAGDFTDLLTLPNGRNHSIENDLADVCGTAHVSKLNHHGLGSMPQKLLSALRSQVYVSCVWCQSHDSDSVLSQVSNRSFYEADRVICPTIMPIERRTIDSEKQWMKDVAKASYEGAHVVLNVENNGKNFSITYLSANDESMTVKSILNFKTKRL